MNSKNCSKEQLSPSAIPNSVSFDLRQLGICTSFKNRKVISINRKTGKRFPRTEPRAKQWMEDGAALIESQLLSTCPTIDGAIPPECLKQLWTAFKELSDDSIREYPEGCWKTLRVPHGMQGVTILIERI